MDDYLHIQIFLNFLRLKVLGLSHESLKKKKKKKPLSLPYNNAIFLPRPEVLNYLLQGCIFAYSRDSMIRLFQSFSWMSKQPDHHACANSFQKNNLGGFLNPTKEEEPHNILQLQFQTNPISFLHPTSKFTYLNISRKLLKIFFFCLLSFLGPHLWHMEDPRLGV